MAQINNEILSTFTELNAQDNSRNPRKSGNGVLTIVNSEKNGNRILISKQLEEDLNLHGEVQILASKELSALLIGTKVPNAQNTYSLRRLKRGDESSRYVIYNKKLMIALAEVLGLDFSDCISHTLYDVQYMEYEDSIIAYVTEGSE